MLLATPKYHVVKKPFVLSMGPQRAGTSWIDRYLRSREDVCLPTDVKEVFYFDRNYEQGAEFYASHFKTQPQHKIAAEISTTSFDHPHAPERVYSLFGNDISLLCPLRHPVTRSYSLYLHYLRYGIVHGTLQDACRQNPQIIESSRYANHLKNWQKHFNKNQISITFQEDMAESQSKFVETLCKSLDIKVIYPEGELQKRCNAATRSHSRHIAGLTQKGADILRKKRLYWIINTAKSLGLKRMIFGQDTPNAQKTTIPEDDRAWLEKQLAGEIENLEALIGPIPQWEKY